MIGSKGYFFSLALMVWVGVACSSKTAPPTQYYWIEEGQKLESLEQVNLPSLRWNRLEAVPPYQTANVVIVPRRAEVRLYNYAKWVAPPVEMLAPLLKKAVAVSPKKQAPHYLLNLRIEDFSQRVENGQVHASLQVWVSALRAGEDSQMWQKTYRYQQKSASETPYDFAVTMNQVVSHFIKLLLDDLAKLPS